MPDRPVPRNGLIRRDLPLSNRAIHGTGLTRRTRLVPPDRPVPHNGPIPRDLPLANRAIHGTGLTRRTDGFLSTG
ncbi:hypothetical protein GCM10010171_53880 [Actinokineospora fastidiosa]|uniref:Uncharacterized protein n=1 Tax=Actinokineospora fastidiosa TaxID=1816 RepID=A0A918GR15_9PSEU|nr:hypothetical protein GCM10010171_53880 [Actinokineospora fastidiosa]